MCGVDTVVLVSDPLVVDHKRDSLFIMLEGLDEELGYTFSFAVKRDVGHSGVAPGSHKLLYA